MFKEKETTAEEIIELVRKSHVEDISGMKETDIDTGFIQIDYEMIELEQRKLLDGKISMCMPMNISQMEEEFAQHKYPLTLRPQYIFSNEELTVDFTFTLDQGIVEEEIEDVRDDLLILLSNLHANYEVENEEVIRSDNLTIATFSFVKPTLDGEVFEYMFLTSIDGQLLIGGFNCNVLARDEWQPAVRQMLHTLRKE
jgi:hypothetical protein